MKRKNRPLAMTMKRERERERERGKEQRPLTCTHGTEKRVKNGFSDRNTRGLANFDN